jgi:hypothetical protein
MYAFYHPDSSLGMGSTRPAADAKAMARPVMRHKKPALPVRAAR